MAALLSPRCYSAKDARVFRRNAIVLPIYQLILLFVFFVGFAAVLQVPGLKGADTNLALFKLAAQQFPPAIVGLIGAAGVFTALVPGSLITMTAAMLLAKNLIGLLRPEATDAQTVALAKWLVPVVMLVAVYFTLEGSATIVALLLVGYSFVTQFFPALVASLMPRNPVTTGRRVRRDFGRRVGRRGPHLHACDHRLAVPCLTGGDLRPQCRHHRACRECPRIGRRERRDPAPPSLGGAEPEGVTRGSLPTRLNLRRRPC